VREGDVLLEIYDTAALQARVTRPGSTASQFEQAIARGETSNRGAVTSDAHKLAPLQVATATVARNGPWGQAVNS